MQWPLQNVSHMENLIQYLKIHYLPATANPDGTITTLNEYIAPDKTYHADPITIPANFKAIRDFLGY